MSSNYRRERLQEHLWRELSSILSYELRDPALFGIDVSWVEVTPDLQTARIFVTTPEAANTRLVMEALDRAKGFLRSQIAHRVQLRRAPELVFKLDHSLHEAQRIDAILNDLADEARPENSSDPTSPSTV